MEEAENELFNSYFIRHTDKLAISPKAILELYSQDLIFIHFPGCDKHDPTAEDKESLNPDDYKEDAKSNMKIFTDLKTNGGFVWAKYNYNGTQKDKIGFVPKGSDIRLIKHYQWENIKYPNRKNKVAIIKAIQMQDVIEIEPGKLMNLRVAQPRLRTLSHWKASKNKLYYILHKKPLKIDFSNLSTPEQEVMCQEFLRHQKLFPNIPQLNYTEDG